MFADYYFDSNIEIKNADEKYKNNQTKEESFLFIAKKCTN